MKPIRGISIIFFVFTLSFNNCVYADLLSHLSKIKDNIILDVLASYEPDKIIPKAKKTNKIMGNIELSTGELSRVDVQQEKTHSNIITTFFKEKVGFSARDRQVIKYKRALNSIKVGKKERAMELLYELLDENPEYYEVRLALADIYQKSSLYDEAEALLNDGMLIDNSNPEFINRLASIMQQRGMHDKSLTLLLKTPEEYRQDPKYKSLLALGYFKEGMHDLARTYYKQLVRINQNNSNWWLGLAVTEDALGNYDLALQSFVNAKMLANLEPKVLNYINERIDILNSIM